MSNFYATQRAMTPTQTLSSLRRLHAAEATLNPKHGHAAASPAANPAKMHEPSPSPSPSTVSLCSMCRVSATPDHVQSDWHNYNAKAVAEGKTPMAQNLYEQFEKTRLQASSVSPQPSPSPQASTPSTNSKNVNQWHWEEKNIASWAFERLGVLLKEAVFPTQGKAVLRITTVKDVEGDAYLNLRKGKLRVGFDLKCKFEWEGEIKAEGGDEVVKVTGKGVMSEIDDTTDEDEYAAQISGFTIDKTDEKGAETLLSTIKKLGPKILAKQVSKLVQEMKAKKDEQ